MLEVIDGNGWLKADGLRRVVQPGSCPAADAADAAATAAERPSKKVRRHSAALIDDGARLLWKEGKKSVNVI